MSGQPSTPPPAARVDAERPLPAAESSTPDWEEVFSQAKVLRKKWRVKSNTDDEAAEAFEAADNACAKLQGAMGGLERDQWPASAYAAAADSLARLARGYAGQTAAKKMAQSRAAKARSLCPNHPHMLLAAAQLFVMDSPPRLFAAKKLLNELPGAGAALVPGSCFLTNTDACREKATELHEMLLTELTSQLKEPKIGKRPLLNPVHTEWLIAQLNRGNDPSTILNRRVMDVLFYYGTELKAGKEARALPVKDLAALSEEQYKRMNVHTTAWKRARMLVALLDCTYPDWLSDAAAAERALKAEAQEAHMRVLCWNLQACYFQPEAQPCLEAKANTLARLLSDEALGCPAVAVLQECPQNGKLEAHLKNILREDWSFVQKKTGCEAAGFLFDETRVEHLFLRKFDGPGWPSPQGNYKPRPPVLALFRTRTQTQPTPPTPPTPTTLLALLSVHLKSADGNDSTMARQQLRALSEHVLPWAQEQAMSEAGSLPVAFLVLGDFNLHGPKDEKVFDKTWPGEEWKGLTNARFRSLLPPDSPSNLGPPISSVDYSYDHVWAKGVRRDPYSEAFVHRPLALLEQLNELSETLTETRNLLIGIAQVDEPAPGGGGRDQLVARIAEEAAGVLANIVRKRVNEQWSDHWPIVVKLHFVPADGASSARET